MRQLTPSELAAIMNELQRQITIEQLNEQKNRWAFLAAVITNGFNILTSIMASAFSGRRRKPKLVEPDDFIGGDAKRMLQRLLGQEPELKDWSRHIEEARAKGLKGGELYARR